MRTRVDSGKGKRLIDGQFKDSSFFWDLFSLQLALFVLVGFGATCHNSNTIAITTIDLLAERQWDVREKVRIGSLGLLFSHGRHVHTKDGTKNCTADE